MIQKVRDRIIERGGSNGIRSIAKLLNIMDDDGDKRLSKQELVSEHRFHSKLYSQIQMPNLFL